MPSRRASWSSATRMRAIGGESVTGSGTCIRDARPLAVASRRSRLRHFVFVQRPGEWLRMEDAGCPAGSQPCPPTEASVNKKTTGFNLAYVLLAALGVLAPAGLVVPRRRRSRPSRTASSRSSSARTRSRGSSSRRTRSRASSRSRVDGKKRFVTTRVEPELAKELDEHGVDYAGRFENTLLPLILSWVVPIALFFGIWVFLGRRMAKQLGGPGRRAHGDRQDEGQGLRRDRHQGDASPTSPASTRRRRS